MHNFLSIADVAGSVLYLKATLQTYFGLLGNMGSASYCLIDFDYYYFF